MRFLKDFFFRDTIATTITLTGILIISSIIVLLKTLPSQRIPQKIVWAAFDGGGSRTGVNTAEVLINPSDVNGLTLTWQKSLPYTTNGAPVEVPNVTTAAGIKDLLFITTQKGSLIALDAATGTKIWQADTQGNFVGAQGTSSSPAVDPSGQFVYSYGLDGYVHKYAVGSGTESKTNNFPVQVTKSTDVEKISSPLNVGNNYLYTVTSGYDGDFGQYVGHAVAINLTSGAITVWNSLCSTTKTLSPAGFCSQKGSGIWGRAGAVVDSQTNNVYVVTGNGNYNANTGGSNYGDSIIALSPDLSRVLDSYTPSSFSSLDSQDDDLGSTGVVILPQQSNTATPSLLVVGGKDNKVRLINKQNMSGAGGPNHVGGELQTLNVSCQMFSHPITWNDTTNTTWVYFTDSCNTLYAYTVVNSSNKSSLHLAYQKGGIGKNSPFMANGILYIATNNNLSALDPTTGNVLWSSKQGSAGGTIGTIHWQSPVVVNGAIYIADDNGAVSAYGLANVTGNPTTTHVPTATQTPSATPTTSTNGLQIAVTVCPHGIGNCGDNVSPNGGNTNPVNPQKSVTVTLLNTNNQQVAQGHGLITYTTTAANFQGSISIRNLSNGQYLTRIKMDGFLSKQLPGFMTISGQRSITLPSVSVVTGDVNNDDQLDLLDYNLIIGCFGSKANTSSCADKTAADINDDGKNDGVDYNLFIRELSVQKSS